MKEATRNQSAVPIHSGHCNVYGRAGTRVLGLGTAVVCTKVVQLYQNIGCRVVVARR